MPNAFFTAWEQNKRQRKMSVFYIIETLVSHSNKTFSNVQLTRVKLLAVK
jgi:hypothetical protein